MNKILFLQEHTGTNKFIYEIKVRRSFEIKYTLLKFSVVPDDQSLMRRSRAGWRGGGVAGGEILMIF